MKDDSFIFIYVYKSIYLIISVALQKQSEVESHHCLTNFLKKSFLRNMKETRNMRKQGIRALHFPSPPTSVTG